MNNGNNIGPNSPGQSCLPWRTADNFNGNLTAATSISSTFPVSQYKYGGKEWNPTSLSYDFGACNYLPAIPRWNSMDPLAEKYYSISPYVYCAGNPVNLVDRDGKDVWEIDSDGIIVRRINDTNRDAFYLVEKDINGNYIRRTTKDKDGKDKEISIEFAYKTIVKDNIVDQEGSTSFSTKDVTSGASLFKFFSDNLSKEVGLVTTSKKGYILMQKSENSVAIDAFAQKLDERGAFVQAVIHSHPGNTPPSGFSRVLEPSDKTSAARFSKSKGIRIDHYVYSPKNQSLTLYDASGIYGTFSWYQLFF